MAATAPASGEVLLLALRHAPRRLLPLLIAQRLGAQGEVASWHSVLFHLTSLDFLSDIRSIGRCATFAESPPVTTLLAQYVTIITAKQLEHLEAPEVLNVARLIRQVAD